MIKNTEDVSVKKGLGGFQQVSKLPVSHVLWIRIKYPYGDTLRGILGDVSTPVKISKRIDKTLLIQRIFTQ